MTSLYALKPWYAERLTVVRVTCVSRQISPAALSVAGVVTAAAAGAAWASGTPGAYAVPLLLAARLAFANLDGSVARESRRTTPRGALANELGDRLADLAMLAGAFAFAPALLVVSALLAASAPSWVSLAGAAAGAPRRNGGPVGKTERCFLVAVAAVTGWVVPILATIAVGSALTAVVRWGLVRRDLAAVTR